MTFDETVASLSNLRETARESGQTKKVNLLDEALGYFDQRATVNRLMAAMVNPLQSIYKETTNEKLRSLLETCMMEGEDLLIPRDIAKRASRLKDESMSALSLASSDEFASALQYCKTCEYVEFLLSIYGSLLDRLAWLDGELQSMCKQDDDINKFVYPFLYDGEEPPTTKQPVAVSPSSPISCLGLSPRVYRLLRWNGIATLKDVCSHRNLLDLPRFGKTALNEVTKGLQELGLSETTLTQAGVTFRRDCEEPSTPAAVDMPKPI